jgi:signal transduction histidine kinase
MGSRMRALDWSRTPLGPVDKWPQSLLSAVSMLLPSKAQICLFWGPEFTVIYNDAYRPVFGVKHPAALGQPGRVAWSEIWDAQLHPLLDGVVRTGEAFHASDLLFPLERHGFVEETYFDVSYDPVRDESGAVGGAYCIVTETTARVVGERRLALLKDLAANAARSPREACERAIETLAGKPDVPFALAYLGDELQAATPGAEAARDAAEPRHVRTLPIPGGRLVLGANPRQPRDERQDAFFGLLASQLSNAIANARAYEEERKRAEALAEIDRAKTAFFSNVSHEFRTPITLMLGLVEELIAKEEGAPQGGRGEALAIVQRNGQRLLKLVNTLLDFARIEAGRAQATYERTDLGALTAELASNFRAACEKAGLALTVEYAPDAVAFVDREMWEKIVLNLLSNAFKFTTEGGITVRLEDAGASLRLRVADTGVGIPESALPRMFERFHRVEGARGRSHEGSGIGLALVQELVRLHGGTIGVQSVPGEGATFTVEIPKGSAHLPSGRIVEPRAQAPTATRADSYVGEALGWLPGAPVAPASAPRGGARILVVDDNADLREYARRLLAEHYEVETAADGLSALKAARQRRPDLVVCDVMMPNLDGFGLIRELRGNPELLDVPVVLLSARAGEEARLEGLSRGADAYLVKPFSARELLVSVASLVASADLRRRALEEEQRYRAFVQASSDVVYRMSADWSELCHLQGRAFVADTHEPSRTWLDRYVPPEDQARVMAAIRKAIDGKTVFELEHRVLRVDGTLGWTFSRAVPILDARGEIVEWLGAASDVTARKDAEAALQDASRRKDEFLATLSHELRNPLAPLQNALQLMRLGDADAVQQIMERQVNHLVRLVDDLLEMSRITRGTFELRRERVELSSVVRNAVETSDPLVKAAKHRLEISLPGEALWLEGDPVRLAQILSNLLNNAAKYTPDGGRIRLGACREGESAVISVSDNGRGIAPGSLSRIFEMFERERHPDLLERGTQASAGLGIGLTLSRRLAEMHGGTIEARSEGLGRGAEFMVRLPLDRGAAAAAAAPRASPAKLASPMRVLLVDDNRDAAASLGMVLKHLGADVHLAYDGKEALQVFDESAPSVVLLDIGMPGMDGYEVARRMRAHSRGREAAIVALTGWGQEEDRRRAREAGFEHHLVKPAEIDVLQKLLAEIQRNRARPA